MASPVFKPGDDRGVFHGNETNDADKQARQVATRLRDGKVVLRSFVVVVVVVVIAGRFFGLWLIGESIGGGTGILLLVRQISRARRRLGRLLRNYRDNVRDFFLGSVEHLAALRAFHGL